MKSVVVDPGAYDWEGDAPDGEASLGLSLNELLRHAAIEWHGVRLGAPDWSDASHSIAFTLRSGPLHLPYQLHAMINAYWEELDFELPPPPVATVSKVAGWRRWIDTSLQSPEDIAPPGIAPIFSGTYYRVAPRSVVVLLSRTTPL